MDAARTKATSSPCPEPDVVAAFSMGKLSADVLEIVAGHVSTCLHCQETLHSLADRGDPLLHDLRETVRHESFIQEPEYKQLEMQALAIPNQSLPRAELLDGLGSLPRIPGFEIVERIGQGGMGIVY